MNETNIKHHFFVFLSGNNLRDKGAASLSESLRVNTTLKVLNLGSKYKRKQKVKSYFHFVKLK